VVEGVILAGLMTNATAGYIFIRHEYGEQIDAVRAEIARAVDAGVLPDRLPAALAIAAGSVLDRVADVAGGCWAA
jgi:NADH:ubiquinone oxidoreductase subunit F (NADH-binding)